MRLCKLLLLCGSLSLMMLVPATALGATPASAQKSVNDLLTQEKQIQTQIRNVHGEIRQISKRIKETDGQITTAMQQLSLLETQKEQMNQELADQYGVLLLPILAAFQDNTTKTSRQTFQEKLRHYSCAKTQMFLDRERLLKQEATLRAKWTSLSNQIAKTAKEKPKEASLDGLHLEQLTNLFGWPIFTTKEVSSDYGWRFLNKTLEFHSGIDVAAHEGDPIYASADGIVLYAGPAQGFGHWIVLQHQQGLLTIYGHMYRSGVNVKPGQTVRKGQPIGKVGADGQSYGPHLHFAIARGMSGGIPNPINPWEFLEK